jgi:hypothetical protein
MTSSHPLLVPCQGFSRLPRPLGRRSARAPAARPTQMCRSLLEGEEHLRTFLRLRVIAPTNSAAGRTLLHAVSWRKMSGGATNERDSRVVERVPIVAAT